MNLPFYYWPEAKIQWSECQGSNAKQVLVLSGSSTNSTNTDFLAKILQAVALDLETDVHFIHVKRTLHAHLISDPQMNLYSKVLLFGLEPSQVGISTESFSDCSVYYFESFTCIMAPALEKIEQDPAQKKSLWSVLKHVFPNRN